MNFKMQIIVLFTTLFTIACAISPGVSEVDRDISQAGVGLLTLDRGINGYMDRPEHKALLENAEKSLEEHVDQATQHVAELSSINADDSKFITDAALGMKSEIHRFLDTAKRKRDSLKQGAFDKKVLVYLQTFEKKAGALSEALQKKVQADDAKKIREDAKEIKDEFDKAIKDFQ